MERPALDANPTTTEWLAPRLVDRFRRMVPEIQRHCRFVFRGVESRRLEPLVARAVLHAFEIFKLLTERGLDDLAYPSPLARTAVARLGWDASESTRVSFLRTSGE